MVGFKDLFRRKSKSGLRSDRSDRSRSQTPEPGLGGRPTSSSNSRTGRSLSTPPPPVPATPTNLSPVQNNFRTSQGFPMGNQARASAVSAAAAAYQNVGASATPERGTYSAQGSGGPGTPNTHLPSQARKSLPNSATPFGQNSPIPSSQVPPRRNVPAQVSAVTSNNTQPSRSPIAQANAYPVVGLQSNQNNFQDSALFQSQSNINPNISSSMGTVPSGNRHSKHDRIVSGSSVNSVPRTPIADEFAAPAWYQQEGSPPIPEFSPSYPVQAEKSAPQSNTAYAAPTRGYDDQSDYSKGTIPNGQLQASLGNTRTTERSGALNHAVQAVNGDRQDLSYQQPGPAKATMETNFADAEAYAQGKMRRQSIPRKSLDKPLPVPSKARAFEEPNVSQPRLQESLPLRERIPPTASLETQNTPDQSFASAERKSISPSSPVRSGQYMRQPQLLSKGETRQGPQQIYNRPYVVEGSASPPSLAGIVNLNNTVDTTTHLHYAPPVVHETIVPSEHHIREERITREIHNYHVYHRILPIIDVQVLPPKHIVRVGDGPDAEWREIPEELVPGRDHHHWTIVETVSRPDGPLFHAPQGPRRFTARTFEGTQGDYKEYINAEGVPTTETWWVHPPIISPEARRRGLTLPLDME